MIYNLDYLNSLIENEIEENLNLEYKAAMAIDKVPSKTIELSKDISSFANSDGGVIIYGIKEVGNKEHFSIELDPINKKQFPKEWIEQIINDKIRPRINHLKIHPVTISENEVVYVIEISKSDTAHQADDKRYYKRYNFQSIPMHDYEIRDILNRSKSPKLNLVFKYNEDITKLHIIVNNVGSVYAKYVKAKFRLPDKIVSPKYIKQTIDRNLVELHASNMVREVVDPFAQVSVFGPPRYEPILPFTELELICVELRNNPFDYENIIEWDIFCDNAEPMNGKSRLRDLLKE